MEMISVTKLARVNKAISSFRVYFSKLEGIFSQLVSSQDKIAHPYFDKKPGPVALLVITSDSGLCGLYNNSILRFADDFLAREGNENVRLVIVGRKGFNYFKHRHAHILNSYLGLNGRYSDTAIDNITTYLTGIFLKGDVSQVHVAYTHKEKMAIYKNRADKLLNMELPAVIAQAYPKQCIFEPDINSLLEEFIPRYIYLKMRLIFLEAFASEHASRAVAMKAATDNAEDLSQSLVLLRNKVRQATITQDILEIISSAEALKG